MTIRQRTSQLPDRSQPHASRPVPEVAGVAHRYVETGRLGIHIAEAGSGPPLLLLHGWPQHWYAWREVIPLLADSWRLICPDLRGFATYSSGRPLASDERIPDGVAGHAEHGGKAGHRHKEYKDWSADRVSGLRVDVDGGAPGAAVEGDQVPAAAVDGGAEVAGRARHHRPGDTALPHAEAVRIGVDGCAPGAAVERERVPLAINGNAEAGRCARHCLQVAAWVDGGWFTPGGAIEGDHVRAVVDGGAEAGARTRHRAQLVARIYGRGGAPGSPVERERVGAVVDGNTEA